MARASRDAPGKTRRSLGSAAMVGNAVAAEDEGVGAIGVEPAGASVTIDGAKLVRVGVVTSTGETELEDAD